MNKFYIVHTMEKDVDARFGKWSVVRATTNKGVFTIEEKRDENGKLTVHMSQGKNFVIYNETINYIHEAGLTHADLVAVNDAIIRYPYSSMVQKRYIFKEDN